MLQLNAQACHCVVSVSERFVVFHAFCEQIAVVDAVRIVEQLCHAVGAFESDFFFFQMACAAQLQRVLVRITIDVIGARSGQNIFDVIFLLDQFHVAESLVLARVHLDLNK